MRSLLIFLLAAAGAFAQSSTFPAAVDTSATLGAPADNVSSALTSPMLIGDTVAQVANATNIPQWAIITFGSELMQVCSKSGNTLTFGTPTVCPSISGRGLSGTSVAAHNTGVVGYLNINAYYHKAVSSAVLAIESNLILDYYNVKMAGAKGDGVTNDAAAINTALASGHNRIFAPCGTYVLGTTQITIPAGVSFENPKCAVFTSAATAIAVLVTAPYRQKISMVLQRTSIQWPSTDSTSIGIKITDSQEGVYDLTVSNFNQNILLTNVSNDSTNNQFDHIESQDGKIGVHLLPAGGFATSQNNFLYAHIRINGGGTTCPAGSPVAGTKYIWHETGSDNQNTWVNPNLEGGCVAQSLRVAGKANNFYNPRFEANVASAVTLDAGTYYNLILNPDIDSGLLSWINDLGQNTVISAVGSKSDSQGVTGTFHLLNKNGVLAYKVDGNGSITSAGSATVTGAVSSSVFLNTGTAPTLNNSGFGTSASIAGVGSSGTITTGSAATSTSGQVLFGTAYATKALCWAQDINAGTYLATTSNSTVVNIFATAGNLPTAHTINFGCTGW